MRVVREDPLLGTLKKLAVYVDGASRGNPGAASIGVVFQDGAKVVKTISKTIGVATNNTAEYTALIFAMQEAVMMRVTELDVYTDSELVARQFSGQYKIKEPSIKLLFEFVAHLKKGFSRLTVTHVPREKNQLADAEANKALDQAEIFL